MFSFLIQFELGKQLPFLEMHFLKNILTFFLVRPKASPKAVNQTSRRGGDGHKRQGPEPPARGLVL